MGSAISTLSGDNTAPTNEVQRLQARVEELETHNKRQNEEKAVLVERLESLSRQQQRLEQMLLCDQRMFNDSHEPVDNEDQTLNFPVAPTEPRREPIQMVAGAVTDSSTSSQSDKRTRVTPTPNPMSQQSTRNSDIRMQDTINPSAQITPLDAHAPKSKNRPSTNEFSPWNAGCQSPRSTGDSESEMVSTAFKTYRRNNNNDAQNLVPVTPSPSAKAVHDLQGGSTHANSRRANAPANYYAKGDVDETMEDAKPRAQPIQRTDSLDETLTTDEDAESTKIPPTKVSDRAGFLVQWKEMDVLQNFRASYVTEGVAPILRQFYLARSRPKREWKHAAMHDAWIPSLVCQHCQDDMDHAGRNQGNLDGCIRLQRRIRTTFSMCLDHLKVCETVSDDIDRICVPPPSPQNDLDRAIRRRVEDIFDEKNEGSSVTSGDDESSSEGNWKPGEPASVAETGFKTTTLVVPEMKPLVFEWTAFLFEQIMPWYVRQSDRENSSFFSNFKEGSRLLVCRHCLGFRSFTSVDNTMKCTHHGPRHLLTTCPCCPKEVKEKLTKLKENGHQGQTENRREFLNRLFGRLHQLDKETLLTAQNVAVRKISSPFASQLRKSIKEEKEDEEEEEEVDTSKNTETEVGSAAAATPPVPLGPDTATSEHINLVTEEYRDLVSERTALLFDQFMPWVVRKTDRENNHHFSAFKVGYRQIVCKYCTGHRSFSSVPATLKNLSHAFKHLVERCPGCPNEIREKFEKTMEEIKQPEKNRKRFVELIFERVSRLDKSHIIRQQELVESAISKPPRKETKGETRKRNRSRSRSRGPRKRRGRPKKAPEEERPASAGEVHGEDKDTAGGEGAEEASDVECDGELQREESLPVDMTPKGDGDFHSHIDAAQLAGFMGVLGAPNLMGDEHIADIVGGNHLVAPEHTFEIITNDWDPPRGERTDVTTAGDPFLGI